jgi:AcrR family transcriptional regulator
MVRPFGIICQVNSSDAMKTSKRNETPPRERIVKAAAELFYKEGIRGVGMEAIAASAQTTKMAIYRHFASKDALVADWLSGVTAQYAAVFDQLEAQHPEDARAQLLGWVRFIVDNLYKVSHRGCPFVNSIAELPDRNHQARQLVEQHKVRQAQRVTRLCRQAGIPHPELAAAELTFLLEGGQVTAQNMGIPRADEMLLALATSVIDRGSTVTSKRRARK